MEQPNTNAHKRKTNGYNSTVLHRKRDFKRSEAEARQRDHDKLFLKDKLAKAKSRPGESKREVARLTALIAATKPVKTVETKPTKAVKKSAKSNKA